MAKSVLRQTIHTSLAKTLLNEVGSRSVKYYFSYGKTDDWSGLTVPDAVDTYDYEFDARKNTVFLQEVTPGDACLVIPRNNWVSGAVYDYYNSNYTSDNPSYSGATSLEEAIYYVVTDELNVYKCLDNNNNATSTVKPTGTSSTEFTTYPDNYIWKFMYTIPPALGNKFLSTTQMPVANAVQNVFYSDGKLEKFFIESKGSGYVANRILTGTVSSGTSLDYRVLTGVGTTFTTDLTPGDYIEVNGEVRKVSTITSDTEITLDAAGLLLYVGESTQVRLLNTWLDITDGDGFKTENPYIVTSIQVSTQGSNYGDAEGETEVVFSDPTLPNGRIAKGTATITAGKVTAITLTDAGFGYEGTPTVEIVDNRPGGLGAGATAYANVIKTTAYIEPVVDQSTGEILNIVPFNSGIGYTYCTITPRRLHAMELPEGVTAWKDASLSANLDTGRIDTKQADVELSAVNGAIHVIKVTRFGTGYAQGATVTVTGDGTGCLATPVIDDSGNLKSILVTAQGKDYTYATITITPAEGNTASVSAQAIAIISPPGGHGKSAIDELYGRTISFFNRLKTVTVKSVPLPTVDYRQICLYRQPRVFASNVLYNGNFGSTSYKVAVTVPNGAPALSAIPLNSIVYVATSLDSTTRVRFRLIGTTTTDMLLQSIDNNDEILAPSLIVIHPNLVNNYPIVSVERPDIEKLSGDIIYIDNRQPFKPLEDQTVSISSRFKF